MSEQCWCGESGCGCKRTTAEIERLRAERDDWKDCANTTKKFCDVKLAEAAAFLAAMAARLDSWEQQTRSHARPSEAAGCRAMARKLRGEK